MNGWRNGFRVASSILPVLNRLDLFVRICRFLIANSYFVMHHWVLLARLDCFDKKRQSLLVGLDSIKSFSFRKSFLIPLGKKLRLDSQQKNKQVKRCLHG